MKIVSSKSRVLPDESFSRGSAAVKATMSETCWPLGSMTLSFWPLLSLKAVPDRGGISMGMDLSLGPMVEGAFPGVVYLTSTILAGFAARSEVLKHGVYRTLEVFVPFSDSRFDFFVSSIFTKLFELGMKVEDHCWTRCLTGKPRAIGVHSNNIESGTEKAKAELVTRHI